MSCSPSANYYQPNDEPEPWDLTQLNIEASVMCLVSKVTVSNRLFIFTHFVLVVILKRMLNFARCQLIVCYMYINIAYIAATYIIFFSSFCMNCFLLSYNLLYCYNFV